MKLHKKTMNLLIISIIGISCITGNSNIIFSFDNKDEPPIQATNDGIKAFTGNEAIEPVEVTPPVDEVPPVEQEEEEVIEPEEDKEIVEPKEEESKPAEEKKEPVLPTDKKENSTTDEKKVPEAPKKTESVVKEKKESNEAVGSLATNSVSRAVSRAIAKSAGSTDTRYFSFSGNTLTGFSTIIDGESEPAPRNIVIPETYTNTEGVSVEILNIGASVFAGKGTYIDSITLNNNLKTIGNNVFENLYGISEIIIPDSVTSIGDRAFGGCRQLVKLTLGSGIRNFGDAIFRDCTSLKDVILKDGLTVIADGLFSGEINMTEIAIPDSVTSIGDYAFNGCTKLAKVNLGSGLTLIGESAFENTTITEIVIPDSVTSIGDRAFNICRRLAKVSLGSGLTQIGEYAFSTTVITEIVIPGGLKKITDLKKIFWQCKIRKITFGYGITEISGTALRKETSSNDPFGELEEIHFPDSLIEIPDDFALYLSKLKIVTLGSGLTQIGKNAFSNTAITEIVIPDSVTSIGGFAFSTCKELVKVSLGSGLTQIGKNAFSATAITEIKIPDSVTSIDDSAFKDCTKLAKVNLGSGITQIKDSTFSGTPITEIVIPDSVTSIGSSAFKNCSKLAKVNLGSGITQIGDNAFSGIAITEIAIPDNVTSINASAFKDCIKLAKISLGSGLTQIGGYAFSNTVITEIVIPDSVTSIDTFAFKDCTKLAKISLGSGLKALYDGVFQNTAITEIVIPDNIERIADSVFAYCGKLTNVTLGSGVTRIGDEYPRKADGAFRNTAITEIEIPDNVTSIGDSTFLGCANLTKITLGSGVTKIGISAFGTTAITEIVIPDSVVSVGASAFKNCTKLAEITIGSNVSAIGYEAFQNTNNPIIDIKRNFNSISGKPWGGGPKSKVRWQDDESYSGHFYYKDSVIQGIKSFPEKSCTNPSLHDGLGKLAIPDEIDGVKILSIDAYAFSEMSFNEIEISNNITSIGSYAFQKCNRLNRVVLGSGIKQYGIKPFFDCISIYKVILLDGLSMLCNNLFEGTAITEIEIPDSVTSIGDYTFSNCNRLTKVTLGSGLTQLGKGVFQGIKITEIEIPDTIKSIGASAFYNCASLIKVSLGSGLTQIGTANFEKDLYGAFEKTAITEIVIPDSVTSIGRSTFLYCTKLAKVTLGSGITEMAYCAFGITAITEIVIPGSYRSTISLRSAFYGCKIKKITFDYGITKIGNGDLGIDPRNNVENAPFCELEEIYFPDSLIEIQDDFALYLSKLKKVTLGNRVTQIGNGAFQKTAITEIEIPDSVMNMGDSAFFECTKLAKVNLPSGITQIGNGVFQKTAITEIEISDNVTSIGDYAFNGCTKLAKVNLGSGITQIGIYAFRTTAITEIVIPDSVTSIGDYAFNGCTKLAKVNLGSGITQIGIYAFGANSITEIEIPDSVTIIDDYAFSGCTKLAKVNLPSGITQIEDCVFKGTAITEIEIPDSVMMLGSFAFKNCSKLAKVTLGSGLTTISEGVFKDTAITEIEIPDSVTHISSRAFSGIQNLKKVVLGSGIKQFGDDAFSSNSNLTEVILRDGLTKIGFKAFSGASISKIVIPDSVTNIGDSAFENCNKLTNIKIPNSVRTIGNYTFSSSSIKMITVDRLRNDTPFKNNEPWGATSAAVYYKNEFIDMNYTVEKNGHKRIIKYTFDAGDLAGMIFTIDSPDGSNVGSVSSKSYSGSYEVNQNGAYDFGALSSANITFPYTVVIDDIGKVKVDGNDIAIRKEILDVTALDDLLGFGDVAGFDIDTNEELDITCDKTIEEIRNSLLNNGDSIQVTVSAENDLGVKESKIITITLDDSAHIVKYFNDDELLKIISVADGDTVDTWAPITDSATFDNWYTDKKYTTEMDFSDAITADMNLYANWNWYTYTIAYNSGFSDISINDKINVTVKDKQLLPTDVSKYGYILKGWKYKGNTVTNDMTLADIYNKEANGSTFTLDALWEKDSYLVNFAFLGTAPTDIPNPQRILFEEKAVSPNIATFEKYTFDGWYLDEACINRYDFNAFVLKDITLYGNWIYYSEPENPGPENPGDKPENPADNQPGDPGDKPTDSDDNKPVNPDGKPINPDNGASGSVDDKGDSDITTDVDGKLDKDQVEKGVTTDEIRDRIKAYDKNGNVDYTILSANYNQKTGKYDVRILLENGEERIVHIPVDDHGPLGNGEKSNSDCWFHWIILLIILMFSIYALISIYRAHREAFVKKKVVLMRFAMEAITLLGTTIFFLLCTCEIGLWFYIPSIIVLLIFMIWFMYQKHHFDEEVENRDTLNTAS